MAMRADIYAALGGFPPLASGEDARLVDDAARAGFRVRHDAASWVHSSARRDGRALDCLAADLRERERRLGTTSPAEDEPPTDEPRR